MRLEARSRGCFSNDYLLLLDGRPRGSFRRRWFSEQVDVRLAGRWNVCLEKRGWLSSRLRLADGSTGEELGSAEKAGLFTRSWNLTLSRGQVEMVSAGSFSASFLVTQDGVSIARVDRIGLCQPAWSVEGSDSLTETDLLLVGLVYHAILRRRRTSSVTGAGS